MNPTPDPFESLRRLLACKRHEQPPPGYYRQFSERVIARIEAEEIRQAPGWWSWMLERLEARPIWACAYGVAVSSLLLTGFRVSELMDGHVADARKVGDAWLTGLPASRSFSRPLASSNWSDDPPSHVTSLAPAYRPEVASLFARGGQFRIQPAALAFSH